MTEAADSELGPPELPVDINLIDCASGTKDGARLVELTAKLAKSKIGGAWWSGLGVSKQVRDAEGDHHWDWAKEIGKYRNNLFVEHVAVQTDDDAIQGAMIYLLNGRSVLAPDEGAVWIDRLAAAPRNRHWLVENPAYRGAGTALVAWASYHSYSLGLRGRVVLAALPIPGTAEFYEGLGFVETDAKVDDMVVYELQPVQAALLIDKIRIAR